MTTSRVYAARLVRCADSIANGTGWLEAIEIEWSRQRDRQEVRHDLEYRWQADGGRLYDGPTDDSAEAMLREWAKELTDHEDLVDRVKARRGEIVVEEFHTHTPPGDQFLAGWFAERMA